MTIEEGKALKDYNTFGIAAAAKYFIEIFSVHDFLKVRESKIFRDNKRLILGGGSNILLTKDFDGLVIKNSIAGIEITSESDKEVIVKAHAGVVWHQFVLWCIDKKLGGIENLSLIPGLVGAAPMQNIGAYGVEIKDVFEELEAINIQTGELVKFHLNDCHFGYRESVFKNKYKDQFLIASLSLRLTKVNAESSNYQFKTSYGDVKATLADMQAYTLTLRAVSDAIIKIRSSKLPDPAVLGNAGSFFKNPIVSKDKYEELIAKNPVMPSYPGGPEHYKIPAGWLIEQCGWKGKRVGNTGSHAKQALVLVNYGNVQGEEVRQLAKDIQQSVKEKFGVDIEEEVNIV